MKITTTIFALFFILTSWAQAQQTQSDYEIQKEFKEQYIQLQQKIDTVTSVDSLQAIIDSVKMLDQKYSEHEDLLNQALFPDTYEEAMQTLRQSSTITLSRLEERQMRTQKLDSLQNQVASYENNIQQLTSQTDSLRRAMRASIQNEREQAALLETYREGLEQRDELILAFIDSMIVAYQQMDLQSLQDLENLEQRTELETDGNALKLIHRITAENLQILQNNSGQLRLQDYVRMSEVQQEFQQMWLALGEEITGIYSGENSKKLASEIENNINQWEQLLQTQTFSALSDSLQAQGVEVQEFTSAQGLYTSLNNYLNEQITQSQEGASEEDYQEYQEFRDFWNKIELQWGSRLVDAGILTGQQLTEIDSKVDEWAENARPQSNLLVWLLGIVVIIAIVLAVLFVRERQNRGTA